MQADIKTKNSKKLKVKVLVDSGCTHTRINKQLIKDKRIQTKPINFSFEVFNADGIKNGEVTNVVATTCHSRTNNLTMSKALSRLSSNEWGNYRRTQQGALAALLLYLYYYIVVHATTISIWP